MRTVFLKKTSLFSPLETKYLATSGLHTIIPFPSFISSQTAKGQTVGENAQPAPSSKYLTIQLGL